MNQQELWKQEYNRVIDHAISLNFEGADLLFHWREGNWEACKEYGFEINPEAYKV